jgi:uncharacterized lipoprotein YmbA
MRAICLLFVLLLIGCSSAPPKRSVYLLRVPDLTAETASTQGIVGVGRVSVAPYLDRAELVVQTGPHEIRPARYHHWGEPLDDGIRHYVRGALTQRLDREIASDVLIRGAWSYQIDLTIETFHGTLSGEVELVAGVVIIRVAGNEVVGTRRVVLSQRQRGDGYPALVDAHAALLDQLADAIADLLGTVATDA